MKTKQINSEYPPLFRGSLFARFFALFFCLSVLGLGNVWGADETITVNAATVNGTNATITCAKGGGSSTPAVQTGGFVRLYASNTVTIAASNGKKIASMKIGWSKNTSKTYASASANVGTYSDPASDGSTVVYGDWSGSAESVVFTIGTGQKQIHSVEITYEGSSTETALYSVTLKDDETVLTQESAGANVTLPSRTTTCTDYTFVGWSETNCATETTTAPTIIEAGDYKPSKNIELYPVFKKTVGDATIKTASVNIATYATANNWQGNGATAYTSITLNNHITVSTTGSGNNGKYYSDWRLYQVGNGNAIVTAADGYSLKSVKFTYTNSNGGQLSYGTDVAAVGDNPSVVTVSGASVEFKVTNSGAATNGQARVTAIEVKYTAEAKDYYVAAPTCVIPTVEKPTLSLAAGEYWGAQKVKVSNYNSENTYYYTLNGDEPDNTKTVYDNEAGINISASATLKVIAYNGAEASAVALAAYTIKPKFASLEELVAADLASNTEVQVSFNNVRIEDFYLNSSNAKKGVYFDIQKESKDIEIYINSADVPTTWEIGGKLSIENLTCNWTRYVRSNVFQCWELTPTSWDAFTYTAAPALDHVVVSGDATKKEYIAGEKFDPAGLTVTAYDTDNNSEVVTTGITWEVTPERVDADVTSVSVKATYGGKTSEAYTVSDLTTTAIPNGTIAGFISNEGGRCYLTGVVSDIVTSGSAADKKCKLTNGESTITIYGILKADRTASTFSALSIVNGDKIKVIAEEYELYSGDHEAKNVEFVEEIVLSSIAISGELTNTTYTCGDAFNYSGLTATGTYTDGSTSDLTSKVTWSIEPASLTYGVTSVTVKAALGEISNTKLCEGIVVNKKSSSIAIENIEVEATRTVAIEATTTPADAELTYTIEEGADYITIEEGVVTGVAVGTATVRADYAGTAEYEAASKTFTVEVIPFAESVTWVAEAWATSNNISSNTNLVGDYETIAADANVDMTWAKEDAGTNVPAYNSTYKEARVYRYGSVTFTAKNGVILKSIEFDLGTVGSDVASNVGAYNAATKTWTGFNNEVKITNTGTENVQFQIKSVTIKYVQGTATTLSIANINLKTTDGAQTIVYESNKENPVIVYSDYDDAVITIADGQVTPVAVGTTTVTATIAQEGTYTAATTTFTVTVANKTVTSLSFPEAAYSVKANESFVAPTLTTTPAELTGIKYTSSNTDAAEVDENTGAVTVKAVGTTTITATFAGTAEYEASEASYELTIVSPYTDVLTADGIGVTSYGDWNNKTFVTATKYVGNSTKGNQTPNVGAIQIRDNNNSGIVSTETVGYIESVSIDFSTAPASGKSVDIYGSHAAYASAADLYDNNKCGTKIGSATASGVVTLAEGNYEFIGVRSPSGAQYMNSISITWTPVTFLNVSIAETAHGTVTVDKTSCLENTVVTITATPVSEDYELTSLKVYKTGDESVEVTISEENTFVMPDYDVTVAAVFTLKPAPELTGDRIAMVVKYSDKYYAISTTATGNNMKAVEVEVLNGNAIVATEAIKEDITWVYSATEDGYVFQTEAGKYLSGTYSTELKLSGTKCEWQLNADGVYYRTVGSSDRAPYYNGSSDFRNYAGTDHAMMLLPIVVGEITTLRENLTPGTIGTYCADKDVAYYEGATFYVPECKNIVGGQVASVYFLEAKTLEAGHAYIYVADGETIGAIRTGDVATEAVSGEALVGTLEADGINPTVAANTIYIVYNNELRLVAEGANLHVGKGKAYLDMTAVEPAVGTPAEVPGRKRVSMGVYGSHVTTGVVDAEVDDTIVEKFFRNGVIYVIRGEHMYDLNGRLVK